MVIDTNSLYPHVWIDMPPFSDHSFVDLRNRLLGLCGGLLPPRLAEDGPPLRAAPEEVWQVGMVRGWWVVGEVD